MGTIIKIKSIGLTKMNNAEYENFMARFRGLISAEGGSGGGGDEGGEDILNRVASGAALGITDQQLAAFDADYALLVDLVNQSRISDETAQMLEVDRQRDDLVVYITSSASQMAKSPIAAQREAAETVRNILKPYVGIYKSPNQQETAQIDGMLADLAKPGIPELIRTMGLTEVVEALRGANAQYATLTAQRTNNKAASIKENSNTVRPRLDALYDDMTTMAFVQSVAAPTAETAAFVTNLNALISETSALYNQRIAAARAAKKKPGEETPGEDVLG